jgi:hypothetical protein
MAQDPDPINYEARPEDPGPGMGASFVACLVIDFLFIIVLGLLNPRPFLGIGGRGPIFLILAAPLVLNGIAIYWAASTKRERCLKGLIICTAIVALLNTACAGLMTS